MPTEFLLPAFALVLLANAVLVAAAMRALWGGRRDPGDWPRSTPAVAAAPRPSAEPADPVDPTPTSPEPPQAPQAPTTSAPAPRSPAARHATRTTPARPTRPPTGSGRGRRRFSLPPLDADHEKVSRSIESFLSSGDAADPPTSDAEPATQTARPTANTGATTVALVAVDGLGEPGDDAVLAELERTLRATARGSDVVTGGKRGRYRIVLKGTGELAARAYLRRFRAAIEPVLAAADGRLRLRIATATILGAPLRGAVELAERRLAALAEVAQSDATAGATATDAAAIDESDPSPEVEDDDIKPRAAGD